MLLLRIYPLFFFLLLATPAFAATEQTLPDLGAAPDVQDEAKQLAAMAKAFGEASMQDNGLDAGDQARHFALDRLREEVNAQLNQQLESWLSPWGDASVTLLMSDRGELTGSHGEWFIPLNDNERYLSWSQLGVSQYDAGTVSHFGVGQRWIHGNWLLGYNTFYDNLLDEHLQRAGLGAQAWGENLRLSANYYQPFSAWRDITTTRQRRMARGYDVTAQARLPFYRHLNTRLSLEQYFGDSVDLFHSGTGYHNPLAVSFGLSYTPVPLVTLSAQHKQGESGISQNNLGLSLNYRFGTPLKKQLQASEVAAATSLRGSRYDSPNRTTLPVLELRARKTLSVFLATPPWDLTPGETVQLKLQVRHRFGLKTVRWQGDTQALSLTPPQRSNSTEGWSIIMPAWDYREGATNRWRLSVVVEDEKGQRVSSNEIALSLTEPLVTFPAAEAGWSFTP